MTRFDKLKALSPPKGNDDSEGALRSIVQHDFSKGRSEASNAPKAGRNRYGRLNSRWNSERRQSVVAIVIPSFSPLPFSRHQHLSWEAR